MKRKVKLADVLWRAANERLDPIGLVWECPPLEHYSCCAVARVIDSTTDCLPPKVDKWIGGLGCDTGSDGFSWDFERGSVRQGVRYMWLLLAMHVAEDEGIEIEVER